MNTRSKTIIIIIATLIIGIVIGMVGSGLLMRQFARKFDEKPIHNRFSSIIERIVEPNENQIDSVRAILSRYGERMGELDRQHISVLTSLIDSMHVELSTILTEEQMKNLDEHQKRARRFLKGRMPFPPPPCPGMHGDDEEPPPGHGMPDDDEERPRRRDRI